MSVILEDALAEEALIAASAAGSKILVVSLTDAGVKAGSTFGAALVMAEFNGHKEIADILKAEMRREQAPIPRWRDKNFILEPR